MKIDNFFAELKRRNVYKVAVAYAVVAGCWFKSRRRFFRFSKSRIGPFGWLFWHYRIGFPIALFIAWAFELTPEGIKSTEDADATAKQSRGRTWIYVAVVGAVLSVSLFVLGRYTAGNATSRHSQAATAPQKSIAILPFENLSEEKANAYFRRGH